MRNSLNKFFTLILICLVAVTFSGCSLNIFNKHNETKQKVKQIVLDAEQERNINLAMEKAQIRVIQLYITIPAQFKAIHKYLDRIYASVDGKVTKVYVEPGDIVKIGQPLIDVKSDTIGQIQLEFLDTYIDVDSQINQMVAMYNLSTQTYLREKTLFKEGISSRAEYEVARAQMLKDKANLDSLRIKKNSIIKIYAQRVALYGGSEASIRRAVATKRIYPYVTQCANKNGIVLDRKINQGEIIGVNQELFNIANLSTIWLVGYAFEKDAPHLEVGQDVTGMFEEEHGRFVKGKLSYVSSILDTDKKTLEVRADIPNKDLSIKPNMYAEMIVDIGSRNTLAVPNSALQKYGDYTFAFVKIAPHTYEERKVEVGQHNDDYTEIKSGLTVGEEVVTQGGFSLLGESIKRQEE